MLSASRGSRVTQEEEHGDNLCPRCGRRLTVYATRLLDHGRYRKRYWSCRRRRDRNVGCGFVPEENITVMCVGSTVATVASSSSC